MSRFRAAGKKAVAYSETFGESGNATIDYPSVAALMERKDVQLSEKDGKLAVAAKLEGPNNTSLAVNGTAAATVVQGQGPSRTVKAAAGAPARRAHGSRRSTS